MPACPFCRMRIDAVIAKFEERRITKYLIRYVTEDGVEVERWDAIDSRVTENSLEDVLCPKCHKVLPLFSEIDIEEFLDGRLLLVPRRIARIINNEKAEFNEETYTIEDEVGGILRLVKEDSP